MKLIDKDALVAEIEKLVDKGKYHEEFDCAYRDGNNGALYALKGRINTLEVKEVDLKKELKEDWLFADKTEVDFLESMCLTEDMFVSLAKKYFQLGLKASNPITAADRGTAEEIIINLKRVEKDYRIDLTREIVWLRNKVKKWKEV